MLVFGFLGDAVRGGQSFPASCHPAGAEAICKQVSKKGFVRRLGVGFPFHRSS